MMANLHNLYCFREVTLEDVSNEIFSQPFTMEGHSLTWAVVILRIASWALVSLISIDHLLHLSTHWCQLEDMFQLIVMLQGIEKVMIQLIDTPTKVYAIGARLFLSKVPLEVLQNWVLIQLIVTTHILGKVQG